MSYDFGGYATKHNIRCSDGRTIMPDAFKDCDGTVVPLVWQHNHDSVDNVLGHAELENRPDGVYAYCSLNDTKAGENAKALVKHGDICALSIYANHLKQQGQNVMHGIIREVSLVLAGANPGATIDNIAFAHSDGSPEYLDDEAYLSYVEDGKTILFHADEEDEADESGSEESNDKTIEEIIDTMNEEQKQALYAIIGALTEEDEEEKEPESAEEAIEHADSEDSSEKEEDDGKTEEETIQDVLDTLSEEQKEAYNKIIEALENGADSVSPEVSKIFDTFSDKQKDAVYAIVGLALEDTEKNIEHASDDGEELGEDPDVTAIISTLNEDQKKAVDEILAAVENGEESVPEEVAGIFDTLNDKQKEAVYALVGFALDEGEEDEAAEHSDFEGEEMKYNIFDAEANDTKTLTHSDMKAIFDDAPRVGSLKEAVLQHGITDIEVLFPEAQAVNNEPYQLVRRMEWVSVVLNGVTKRPFSRIKSTAVNLTEEQARAKGYIKGRKKIEEQIAALKRITTPQTIYKLQKLDRDDIIDITDFDVVAFMKQEMRLMLDEEIARAILIGDGRLMADPEKILPDHVRPVWSDDEMYTIHKVIAAANATDYSGMIDEIVRSRKGYKGSGNPVMFIGPDILTEMRLLKDNDNRFRYDSDAKLAEALRVSAIHEVEIFDDQVRTVEGKDRKLVAVILNLADYCVGATKGGEVSLFDDFDLNYNKYEYLIETRMSGALVQPKSAIAIEIQTTTDSQADPVYVKVASPVTADIADYFEMDEYGRISATTDVAVVTGKTYYEVQE
ncbi:MAG: HK97 family phage prohead protease [Exiguobacterium sp.]|nr:HK97 family phage prohead protease [Exiguobacterium sp.]